MAKFELTEQQLNNLTIFINRVKFEGLNEVQAINEIMAALSSPIAEGKSEMEQERK